MKIAAALAAVKVSCGWSRQLKQTSSPGFQAAAEDRSRKCELAVNGNGRESKSPRQTRDTRGCDDAGLLLDDAHPRVALGRARGFVCRGKLIPARTNVTSGDVCGLRVWAYDHEEHLPRLDTLAHGTSHAARDTRGTPGGRGSEGRSHEERG